MLLEGHPVRIVQITDTHLSARPSIINDNFAHLVGLINELRPALVVHSGDVEVLNPANDADRRAAAAALEAIEPSLKIVPGNHDVGESVPEPWAGLATRPEWVDAYRAVFGRDYWLEILDDWAIIGLNSETLGSGQPAEAEQWAWIDTLPALVGARYALVFSHRPFWPPVTGRPGNPAGIMPDVRDRLLGALEPIDVRAFGAGHLHYYGQRAHLLGSRPVLAIAGPPTGFADYDAMLRLPGISQPGIVEYQLDEQEPGSVRAIFRTVNSLDPQPARVNESWLAALHELGQR